MEETKEVVSCSNAGLIQIISLIFLQERNKKAPYVQPEKAFAKLAVARTLGTVCGGAILTMQFESTSSLWWQRLDHRPYSSAKEWNQPFAKGKRKAVIWSIYISKNCERKQRTLTKEWGVTELYFSCCHYQWFMQRKTVTAWQCHLWITLYRQKTGSELIC